MAKRYAGRYRFVRLAIRALLFFISVPDSSARLGETFDQVQTRYGLLLKVDNVTRADYPQYFFEKDGVQIRVRFVRERSAQEIFTGTSEKIQTIAAEILNVNAQGSTWSSTAVGKATEYMRADGNATAQYIRPKRADTKFSVLQLQTTDFGRAFNPAGTQF